MAGTTLFIFGSVQLFAQPFPSVTVTQNPHTNATGITATNVDGVTTVMQFGRVIHNYPNEEKFYAGQDAQRILVHLNKAKWDCDLMARVKADTNDFICSSNTVTVLRDLQIMPHPEFLSPGVKALDFSCAVTTNCTGYILTSTDMVNWVESAPVTLTYPVTVWIDFTPDNVRKFYAVKRAGAVAGPANTWAGGGGGIYYYSNGIIVPYWPPQPKIL